MTNSSRPSASPYAPDPSLQTPGSIGDILLTFSATQTSFPARTKESGWQPDENEDDWALLTHPPASGWKGFPCRSLTSKGWRLWVLGEFYEEPDELSEQDISPGDVESLHRLITTLNGHFLILAWYKPTRRWHLWTNRFGTIHIYYASDGKRAALGTFLPAVAAAASQRRLDWTGLTGFFAFGFFPQDLTHFQDAKILRPASHYLFDENGRLLTHERYWAWWHEPDWGRSYDDTVAEFAHIFGQVMRDCIQGGRIAIPISGGLDSRSTVATLPPSSVSHLWSYSYGYSDDSVETRIARRVAAAHGLPFQSFTIQPYLFDKIEQVLAWTEGFQDITQPRQAYVCEEIATHADYLIAALWGDVWHDDMGFHAEGTWHDDDVVAYALHKMEKDGQHWLLDHLVRPRSKRASQEGLLREMVTAEMAPLAHIEDPDFRVKAFKTEQWSFRWSLPPIRVFQSAAFPRLVFYDTRLADFFCTVPTEYVSARRLQIDYLKRFAPDLARITWQVYDTNLYRYQYFNSWLIPKRAIKKAWRILTRKKIIERNWEVQFINDSGRRGLEHWLLRTDLLLHEFVSPSAVRELLDAFYSAPLEQGRCYTVSMLLSFSAWLELQS